MNRDSEMAVFAASVDLGSLSAAALHTGLSLASVSRKVSGLERRLGVRLLIRSTRGLALTEAGREYYESAKRILAEIDELETGIVSTAAEPAGRLLVTAPTLFGRVHLLPLIAEFLSSRPRVTLEIVLLDRPVNLVEEGVDVAIVVGVREESSLIARGLGTIRWVLCASPDYIERRGTPKEPRDLSSHDCLMYTQHSGGDQWTLLERGRPRSVRVPIRMRSNTIDGVIAGANAGIGIALVPAWAISDDVRQGRLKILLAKHELPPKPVSAVITHNRLLANRVRSFVDFLAERLAAITHGAEV